MGKSINIQAEWQATYALGYVPDDESWCFESTKSHLAASYNKF
jgi:hypothetical protein